MYQLCIPLFGLSVVALYAGTMRSYLVLMHPEPLDVWGGSAVVEMLVLLATVSLGVCSYARTVLTPPGFVDDPEVQALLRRRDSKAAAASRGTTVCKHCGVKPFRAYHCRHTGRCVLRLDHFCIFSNCAIGAGNYKYFLLWQFYQLVSSAHMARLNFQAVTAAVRDGHNHVDDTSTAAAQVTKLVGLLIPAIMCLLGSVFTFAAPAAFFPAHMYRAAHNISGGTPTRHGFSVNCKLDASVASSYLASFAYSGVQSVEYAKDLRWAHGSECSSKHGGTIRQIDEDALRDPLGTTKTAAELYDCGGIWLNLDRVLGTRRFLWLLPVNAPDLACVLHSVQGKLAND